MYASHARLVLTCMIDLLHLPVFFLRYGASEDAYSRLSLFLCGEVLRRTRPVNATLGFRGRSSHIRRASVGVWDQESSVRMGRLRQARSKRTTAVVCLVSVAPQSPEELRPWLLEVERARRRGFHVRKSTHITRLTKPGAAWRWTVACSVELMNLMADSRVPYPLIYTPVTTSGPQSNSAALPNASSQGTWHESWIGGAAEQG